MEALSRTQVSGRRTTAAREQPGKVGNVVLSRGRWRRKGGRREEGGEEERRRVKERRWSVSSSAQYSNHGRWNLSKFLILLLCWNISPPDSHMSVTAYIWILTLSLWVWHAILISLSFLRLLEGVLILEKQKWQTWYLKIKHTQTSC